MYIHIYTRYTSPRPGDQVRDRALRPPARVIDSHPAPHATDSHTCPRGLEPARPVLTPRHVVRAASRSSQCDPDRADGPRTATTSHGSVIFCSSLSHFDKALAIFEFSVNHFATSLLQCSTIFVSVLSHFRELGHFLIATMNSGILVIGLSHFMILSAILLHCSAIVATLLSHFLFFYSEFSHFYDLVSHFLQ
jgi:hypothetical protein